MSQYEIEPLLTLYALPGIGPSRLRNLITTFGSPQAVLEAPIQKLIRIEGINKHTASKIKEKNNTDYVKKQLTYFKEHGIKILTYWAQDYPVQLKKIYDAPVLLFYLGDKSALKTEAIGIVGTRHPSSYGKMITEKFSRELATLNFTVISGLARGVDTVAHQSALKAGGKTVAVLGSGLDQIYPPENKKIAKQISEKGMVISEFLIGAIPEPCNFPRRNRIISGLSLGILVTEAGKGSGALITAYQALDQNREVFAVPGPINSIKSMGANLLLKQGAKLIQDTSDIIQEIESQFKSTDAGEKPHMPQLSEIEQTVYEMLSEEPVHIDFIAQRSQKTTAEILTVLLTLELLGVIKQLSGKMFVKFTF